MFGGVCSKVASRTVEEEDRKNHCYSSFMSTIAHMHTRCSWAFFSFLSELSPHNCKHHGQRRVLVDQGYFFSIRINLNLFILGYGDAAPTQKVWVNI